MLKFLKSKSFQKIVNKMPSGFDTTTRDHIAFFSTSKKLPKRETRCLEASHRGKKVKFFETFESSLYTTIIGKILLNKPNNLRH